MKMDGLARASQSNQAAIIELLLDRHVDMRHMDMNELDNDNRSALYYACYWANVEAARLLLARGANVDLGDPPILAARQDVYGDDQADMDTSTLWARRLQVVRLLADHNANLNVVDAEYGSTALMRASRYNQADIIELLLDRHVDISALNNDNRSALWHACYYANVEAAQLLLARGANVDLGDPPILQTRRLPHVHNQTEADKSTFWARRLQVVRLLVDHNANLNVVDANGTTALINASGSNQPAIIEFLLDRHVDIDTLNDNDESALYLACYFSNLEAVRLLLARGANVDLGNPPILAACQSRGASLRRLQIVQLLVKHNANVNVVDGRGETPLMYAYNFLDDDVHSVDVARCLLKCKADTSVLHIGLRIWLWVKISPIGPSINRYHEVTAFLIFLVVVFICITASSAYGLGHLFAFLRGLFF